MDSNGVGERAGNLFCWRTYLIKFLLGGCELGGIDLLPSWEEFRINWPLMAHRDDRRKTGDTSSNKGRFPFQQLMEKKFKVKEAKCYKETFNHNFTLFHTTNTTETGPSSSPIATLKYNNLYWNVVWSNFVYPTFVLSSLGLFTHFLKMGCSLML